VKRREKRGREVEKEEEGGGGGMSYNDNPGVIGDDVEEDKVGKRIVLDKMEAVADLHEGIDNRLGHGG